MITRCRTILICALVAGCGQSSERAASFDSSHANEISLSSGTPIAAADSGAKSSTPCPRTGKWAVCSVEKRLERSGFVVRPVAGDPPRRAGFSVAPTVYRLGRSRLEVFIYADEASLARDVARLDTVTVAPRGAANNWGGIPTFVRSANLVAVFLTDNAAQAERLTLALTAGAPQR
jgi:hypothetical protein